MERQRAYKRFKAPPRTTRSGAIVTNLSRILYDIIEQFEQAGKNPCATDIHAVSPVRDYKHITKTLAKMRNEGIIETPPGQLFKRSKPYRIAAPVSTHVYTKLTPSGHFLIGKQLYFYLVIEALDKKFPVIRVKDIVAATKQTRNRVFRRLNALVRKGVLVWDGDKQHIKINKDKVL